MDGMDREQIRIHIYLYSFVCYVVVLMHLGELTLAGLNYTHNYSKQT